MQWIHKSFSPLFCAFLLSSCASHSLPNNLQQAEDYVYRQNVTKTTHENLRPKPVQTVAFYNTQPHTPYRIIGTVTVSRFNALGLKRSDSAIQMTMRQLAGSIGGNGLIPVYRSESVVQANVILFQKVLV